VHQQAVDNINKAVSSPPVLRLFDQNIPMIIKTDASSTGLGLFCYRTISQSLTFSVR